MKPDSLWKLRWDLLSSSLLLWIAGAGRIGDPTPEVHCYLAELYFRLSEHYEFRGNKAKARRFRNNAEFHRQLAGPDFDFDPDDEPPVAAMAMPIPRKPTFTDAIARWRGDGPSDDVA
jgi:hypothetical protein